MGWARGEDIHISPHKRAEWSLPDVFEIPLTGDLQNVPAHIWLTLCQDSHRPPGQRVLGVWLSQGTPNAPSERSDVSSGTGIPALADRTFIKREKNDRTYKIITREYTATGHCGYTCLGDKYQIGDENGQPLSGLVREHLRGGYRYTGQNDAHFTFSGAGTRRVRTDALDQQRVAASR